MWDQWQCRGWVRGPGGGTRLLHLLPFPCVPQLGPISPLGINDSFFHRFPLLQAQSHATPSPHARGAAGLRCAVTPPQERRDIPAPGWPPLTQPGPALTGLQFDGCAALF